MSSGMSLNGKEIFESDWLGSIDLGGKDLTVKIALVEKAEVFNPKTNAKSMKLAFRFDGQAKGMICNRTNATTISKLYGTEASAWTGKQITLYPTTCKVGRETTTCLRVREKVPGGSKQDTSGPKSEPPKQEPKPEATAVTTESFKEMKAAWQKEAKAIGGVVDEATFRAFVDTTTGGMVSAAGAMNPQSYSVATLAKCLESAAAMMPRGDDVPFE